MIGNLVTSQVVRYVTDKVVENLSKQAMVAVGGQPVVNSSLGDSAILAHLQNRMTELNERLSELNGQLDRLDGRVTGVEAKTGWRHTIRLTFGIILGVAVGFGAAELAHVVGWLG